MFIDWIRKLLGYERLDLTGKITSEVYLFILYG